MNPEECASLSNEPAAAGKKQARYPFADERAFLSLVPISNCRRGTGKPRKGKTMSDQMSRRGFMGAAATGAVALAGGALAGCSSTSASAEKSSEKEKAVKPVILVTSFGTSYNDSRHITIGAIEDAIREKYWQDYDIRRAFTAQIIIDKLKKRDGITIDNMTEALDRCVEDGVKEIGVQPTHLMHGAEYDEMNEMLDQYRDKFESVAVAEPLLGEVGADASVINADKEAVAKAVTAAAVKEAGYDSAAAAAADKTAFVFMGHGTSHTAKVSYSQMQTTMQTLGYDNVFIGTVEGEPEDTSCEAVIEAVKAAGYTKVILRPLMVVAGDHANNDMAGEDADSWLSQFTAAGCFENVDCQISGLGRIADIQQLYIAHTKAAMDLLNG